MFTSVGITAVYSNPASKYDLEPLIFDAVARVISKHPALSAIFADLEKSKLRYVQLPQIDLRDCVVFLEQEPKSHEPDASCNPEWDRLLEDYHNRRFDDRWGELPLWRLLILHEPQNSSEFTACFIYQHTVCDGLSGPAFHRALLAELQAISADGVIPSSEPIVRPPDTPLLPNLESLHHLPLSPRFLLKMVWLDAFPKTGKNIWLGGPVSEKTRSRFLSLTLSAAETSRLVALSKTHSASLTATTYILVALAIFANLPDQITTLKSSMAISMRRFLPRETVDENSLGNWVYVAYNDVKRPKSTSSIPWDEVRQVKKDLNEQVNRNGKNTPLGCLKYAGNLHRFFDGRSKKPREGTFLVSNLGTFKPRENNAGPWKVGRMVFSEGFDTSGEAIDITMITGGDGCLSVGFVWGEGVVEEELMLKFFNSFKKLMVETAESSNF